MLKSDVVDNSFYKLRIEKKDFDLSLVGKHVVLIKYTFKENRRSIIKELELDIASIIDTNTKAFYQHQVIVNYDKTFDGVDQKMIVDALKMRDEQKSKGIYKNQLPLKPKVGSISPDGFFKIHFNKDHLVPETMMEPFEFEKLF